MVDWDRVEELREKGWDWDRIASDLKVGFHPDVSVRQAGPALRRLYYRRKSREDRQEVEAPRSRRQIEEAEKKWPLVRYAYLITPIVGIWALLAFLAPSPVGLIVSWFPYLTLAFAAAVFFLAFMLFRTDKRWSTTFRSTVIGGIVLGLVVSGAIGLTAILAFGCPYLPPAVSLGSQPAPGWAKASVSPWQQNGMPVVYFYGATWCPFCSASSWALWKALTEFQSGFTGITTTNPGGIPGAAPGFSSLTDVYAGTPEMILASAVVTSSNVAFLVSEDTSGVGGTFPGTSGCYEQAYVTAYSGGSIPFAVINGQFVHGGSTIIDPASLSSYTYSSAGSGGAATVAQDVLSESGAPWSAVMSQAAWITAYIIRADGSPSFSSLAKMYNGPDQWTSTMQSLVSSDLGQI